MQAVNLIAAIGKQGQIGHKLGMPWVNVHDLAFFKKMTMGAVIIFGTRTLNLLPPLPGRVLHPYTGRYATPKDTLLYVREAYPGWPIWIGGGARTYRDFAPYVDGLKLLSVIDYDGEADTYFPFDAYGMPFPENRETEKPKMALSNF